MAALSTAEAPRLIPERTLPWFLGTALGYFLLSSLTLAGFPRTEAVVAFFPASGLALAAMLLTPRHQRPWLALGILVADFTADQVFGRPILVAHLTFAPIMAIEAWLGAWLIEWWLDGRSPDIRSLADFGTIVTASAIGSTLVGGVLGGLAQRELFGLPFFPALWNWWAPDLMASSVLTPALLFSAQLRQETATPSPGVKPEGLLFLLTFGAVLWEVQMNGISIGASQVLLLLAALPFLGWAALRLGPTWTAWGTVLLTAVSVAATAYGRGPFIATSADPFSRMLWCQAFCMVTSLSMMVLAQTLREQRSAALRLAEALQALTVSNARIQAQFQGSSDPMAMVDSELRLVAFNPAWAELVGHSTSGAATLGTQVDLVSSSAGDGGLGGGAWRRALAGDRFRESVSLPTQDGNMVAYEASYAPLQDGAGLVIGASQVLWNVAELDQRHAEQARAQRLESMGRLACGVAHDFNNIITAIIGYGELIKGSVEPDSRVERQAGEVVKAGGRAASLTRQMLAFARRQVMQPIVVDPAALLAELHPLIERVIGEGIQLTWKGVDAPWKVKVDPGQLEQVLVNLIVNARDAMPKGGRLTIETANIDLDPLIAHGREVPPGPYCQISVSDTGSGIPPEVLKHIFEPFFTTKERGTGTGLGLAMVEGTIRQAGGAVLVYSEVGTGTVFRILLPKADGAAEARPRAGVAPSRKGGEHILLVEDDPTLLSLSRQILESAGYTVHMAATGAEAKALPAATLAALDLLLTDVMLPGISGFDLADWMRTQHPQTKCLFVSGYTEETLQAQGRAPLDFPFLPKPYSTVDLLGAVGRVLDRP